MLLLTTAALARPPQGEPDLSFQQTTLPAPDCTPGTGQCAVPPSTTRYTQSAFISNPSQLDALTSYTEITGFLYLNFDTSNPAPLSLPNLQCIGGYIYANNTGVTALSMPNLVNLSQYMYVTNNSLLSSIDLSSLDEAGRYIYIYGNGALPQQCIDDVRTQMSSYEDFSSGNNGAGPCP